MKRLIIITAICLIASGVKAQTLIERYIGAKGERVVVRDEMRVDSAFQLPSDTLKSAPNGSLARIGSTVYIKNGTWQQISSTGGNNGGGGSTVTGASFGGFYMTLNRSGLTDIVAALDTNFMATKPGMYHVLDSAIRSLRYFGPEDSTDAGNPGNPGNGYVDTTVLATKAYVASLPSFGITQEMILSWNNNNHTHDNKIDIDQITSADIGRIRSSVTYDENGDVGIGFGGAMTGFKLAVNGPILLQYPNIKQGDLVTVGNDYGITGINPPTDTSKNYYLKTRGNIKSWDTVAVSGGSLANNFSNEFSIAGSTVSVNRISPSKVLRWYDVRDFGAIPNDGIDDAPAFNNCLQVMMANGGGKMYIPYGIWETDSEVVIPKNPDNSNRVVIELVGETQPNIRYGTIANPTTVLSQYGSIIKSNAQSGSAIRVALSDNVGNFLGFNNVFVTVRDLEIRTYNNPKIHGLNLFRAQQCQVENVFINNGVYAALSVFPEHQTTGLITPNDQNAGKLLFNNIVISGFYIGMQAHEHTTGDNISIYACYNGIQFNFGSHASTFGKLDMARNTHHLRVIGQHRFSINMFNTEDANPNLDSTQGGISPTSAWQVTQFHINDSSNLGEGKILNWYSHLGGAGAIYIPKLAGAGKISLMKTGEIRISNNRDTAQQITAENPAGGLASIAVKSLKFGEFAAGQNGASIRYDSTGVFSIGRTSKLGQSSIVYPSMRFNTDGEVQINNTVDLGTSKLQVTGNVLIQTEPFGDQANPLRVIGTMPSTSTNVNYGGNFQITSTNTTHNQYALNATLKEGGTSDLIYGAARFENQVAGTGVGSLINGDKANIGSYSFVIPSTSGHNVGVMGTAGSSTTLNFGVLGKITNNVGGGAALAATNTSTIHDILRLYDSTTLVYQVFDEGNIKVHQGTLTLDTSTTAAAPLIIPGGVAPTTPPNGAIWHSDNNLYARLNGVNVQLNGGGGTTYTFNNSSIVNNSGNLTFSGDLLAPGNYKVYGTNASGTKGWQAASALPVYTSDTEASENGSFHYLNSTDNRIHYFSNNTWYIITGVDNAVTYDTDAQGYFDRLTSAGVSPTLSQKTAINTYIVGLKADGIWAKITDRCLPIWGTAAASSVTLKNVATPSGSGSPAYTTSGVDFNGTSQYISTGIVPSTSLSQDNIHVSYYCREDVTAGTKYMFGTQVTGGTNILGLIGKNASNLVRWFANTTTVSGSVTNSSTTGYFQLVRTASNLSGVYKNGSLLESSTQASTGLPNAAIFIGAQNSGNGTAASHFDGQCAMWSVGQGLTATEAANDNTRTETLMDALGIGVQ